MSSTIWFLAGALLAIAATISFESLRRPRLRLRIATVEKVDYPEGKPARAGRDLRLWLENKPLPGIFRWLSRDPALQCRGSIAFYFPDGRRCIAEDMPARFSDAPEPVPLQVILGGMRGTLTDPMRMSPESNQDVFPGERALLDVVAIFDDDDACYGWSNANYHSVPLWRNPRWKLARGRYLVRVSITSNRQRISRVYRLVNDGKAKDFRLEPAAATETLREDRCGG